MTRVIRGFGWTLLVSGVVVLLYVVYLLWFTGLETNQAQRELAEAFPPPQAEPAPDDDPADGQDPSVGSDDGRGQMIRPVPLERDETIEVGDAFAALWFERDGERIVNDDVLYVVSGVSLDVLRAGPGHYPDSDVPGGDGNLAIAGHRTTYGAPFWSVNELQDGDTIHVIDRQGREWTYAYREQRIVRPQDVEVIYPDPLGTGEPTITLTTCHPRGSARERLIAFGELVEEPLESTAGPDPFQAELPGEA